MKIVTWNCNLNLERKFDLLQSLTPDKDWPKKKEK